MENSERSYQIWTRVDTLKGNLSLSDLSAKVGMKYQRMKEQRSSGRIPSAEDLYALAKGLGTSMEFLLTGEDQVSALSLEAQFVEKNETMKTLVRYCMKDAHLLSALEPIIEQARVEGKEMII